MTSIINKKLIFFLCFTLFFDICAIIFYGALSLKSDPKTISKIKEGVRLTTLPDISLVTEARYIRHRSISDIYTIFDFSPEVREVFPTSFLYSPSPAYNSEKALEK